jgi:hypothetical protein
VQPARLLAAAGLTQVRVRRQVGIRVHRDAHVLQRQHLAELLAGELRLHGPAAPDDVHLAHRAALELRKRVRRDVGARERSGGLQQHARAVERDVAQAHDAHALDMAEVYGEVRSLRVAVVPVDELARREAVLSVLARDFEPPVAGRAVREHDGAVHAAQLVHGHCAANRDVAEEADVRARCDLRELVDHVLRVWVVRRDPGAHEAERRRQLVEDVDADVATKHARDAVCEIEARWPAADDRDAGCWCCRELPAWRFCSCRLPGERGREAAAAACQQPAGAHHGAAARQGRGRKCCFPKEALATRQRLEFPALGMVHRPLGDTYTRALHLMIPVVRQRCLEVARVVRSDAANAGVSHALTTVQLP